MAEVSRDATNALPNLGAHVDRSRAPGTRFETDVPDWISILHRVATIGDPDPDGRAETLALWGAHAQDIAADPATGVSALAATELRSASAHVLWRITAGPTTVMANVVVTFALAIAFIFLAATESYTAVEQIPVAILTICVGLLAMSEGRTLDSARSKRIRAGWALTGILSLSQGITYLAAPVVPSDSLVAASVFILATGLLGMARKSRSNSWVAWAILSVGMLVASTANWIGSTEHVEQAANTFVLWLAVGQLLLSFTLVRWAIEVRTRATGEARYTPTSSS